MIAQNKIHEKMALYHQNSSKFQVKPNSAIPTCLVILTLNKRNILNFAILNTLVVILGTAKYPYKTHREWIIK